MYTSEVREQIPPILTTCDNRNFLVYKSYANEATM